MSGPVNLPLCKSMCATCPFRAGSPYADLAATIAVSALTESRICHSTGCNNGINRRTDKRPHLCRGARDLQLKTMFRLGAIEAPTDEAWNAERVNHGMQPTVTKDP